MIYHGSEVVHIKLPARYTYLHIVSDCIADMLGLVDTINDLEVVTYNIQLAAHEICTNIVNHAYKGTPIGEGTIEIILSLHRNPQCFELCFRDNGCPFDPELVPSPSLQEAQVHGYGLFLARSLMDNVTYTSSTSHNQWYLVKQL